MNHGSLFSGIGGFDLAAEWMGWSNKFHCEMDEFNRTVLSYHFKNAVSYENIKTTDFRIWRGKIDILTGGFPCQPFSTAGKRKGTEDERYLWDEMLRAIQEIKPSWVVGENVRGIVNWSDGLVFEKVCADLEAEGYEVLPFILPACGVNAPHRRDRVWFIAYSTKNRRTWKWSGIETKNRQQRFDQNGKLERRLKGLCVQGNVTNSKQKRLEGMYKAWRKDHKKWEDPKIWGTTSRFSKANFFGSTSHTMQTGGRKDNRIRKSRFIDKTFQTNNWENFPTKPPVCGGDDGIPTELDDITVPKWRKQSLMAYGNAIVPQVAHQIFKAIKEYETTTKPPDRI